MVGERVVAHVVWDGTGTLFGVPLHSRVGGASVHGVVHLRVERVLCTLRGPVLFLHRNVLHHVTHVRRPVVPLGIGSPLHQLRTHGVVGHVVGGVGVSYVPGVRGTELWVLVVVRWVRFEV